MGTESLSRRSARRELGQKLQKLRQARNIPRSNLNDIVTESLLKKVEQGTRTMPRTTLIKLLACGYGITNEGQVNRFLIDAAYDPVDMNEKEQYRLQNTSVDNIASAEDPLPQKVIWGRVPAGRPGIFINSIEGRFIEWEELKGEIEQHLLPKVVHLPPGCTAITKPYHGHEHYLVRAVHDGKDVAAVWIGGDPYKDWAADGLVRVGWTPKEGAPRLIVWLVAQRMSDGSYRNLQVFDRDGSRDVRPPTDQA